MQGTIHSSCCVRVLLTQPCRDLSGATPLNLTLFRVNAIRRCLAVRNSLYGHQGCWPGHSPWRHHCGGEVQPSPALTSCCWDGASQEFSGGEGWTFWDAVRDNVGRGSASSKPGAEWGCVQSTRGTLRLSIRDSWVHCGSCTRVHACLAFHSHLCSPLASRTTVRNPQASPEAFSCGK